MTKEISSKTREFTKELLSLQKAFGLSNLEMGGRLIGCGVVIGRQGGLTKGQLITIASKTFDDDVKATAANDT